MLCNKGRHQSPIDIIPDQLLFDPNLIPLQITGNQVSFYKFSSFKKILYIKFFMQLIII